jgi:hypothetical protein
MIFSENRYPLFRIMLDRRLRPAAADVSGLFGLISAATDTMAAAAVRSERSEPGAA